MTDWHRTVCVEVSTGTEIEIETTFAAAVAAAANRRIRPSPPSLVGIVFVIVRRASIRICSQRK